MGWIRVLRFSCSHYRLIADLELPFRYFFLIMGLCVCNFFTLYKEKVSVGSKNKSFKPGISKHDFL